MMQFNRARLMTSTALGAVVLPALMSVAQAQSAGFAIEIVSPTTGYSPTRASAQVSGPVSEAAASFVRGCPGFVAGEAEGVPFELVDALGALNLTAAGEGVTSLVVGSPDGLFQCAIADEQGRAATVLSQPETGRYMAWVGTSEGGTLDARVIASSDVVSAIELFGINVESFGEPRVGREVFTASFDSGRQTLAQGAPLVATSEMSALDPASCFGYGDLSAADVVLTLDEAKDQFSIFALSARDLVMAVVTPDGSVLCDDDNYQLNPGVTLNAAEAGEYHIFVGGYSQGGEGQFDLFASEGGPAFTDVTVNANAEPRYGRAVFDMVQAGGGQRLVDAPVTSSDPLEGIGAGPFCAGYSDVSAPDMVLTLDESLPMMSIYAESPTDLVMAVRAPDGSWLCNDDSNALNPAVSVENAQAGEYAVFVGTYMQGDTGDFTLYTSVGSPNWPGGTGTIPGQMPSNVDLNAQAEPTLGRIDFGPETRIDPRFIFDIEPSQTEAFGLGDGCAGFITPSHPDLVISVENGLPQLMTYVVSDNDGTLAVVAPDGTLHCNDDFNDLNPGVMIPNPQAGDYAVFVGSYTGNGGLATLGVTIANPVWAMDREH